MPYPNYHAARIRSPGTFLQVRVMQTTKKGIMIYGGPLKKKPKGPAMVQSIRFPKDRFTSGEAKSWLKEHDIDVLLFEPAKVEKGFL